MNSTARLAVVALLPLLLLGGCGAPAAAGAGAGTPPSAPTPVTPPTAGPPAASPATPPDTAATIRHSAPPVVVPTGADAPFHVGGVAVVNKQHPLPRSYTPAWASKSDGVHPEATGAVNRLIAAARADGLKLTVRSGYRSYPAQSASFARALATYDEATARRYVAEPGKSEHQTGLALDLWDGRNRGTAFSRTPQARWIAKHAHEFGFIVRYPPGKEDVTGYAWEAWHLRYVGTAISARFGPDSTLTLEEFLGLA